MANKYEWAIESLDCVPMIGSKYNVVSCVHWRVNGTDGVHKASIYGTQEVKYTGKTPFTAYPSLTKDQVVDWVQEAMGIDVVTSLQQNLDNQINALANPPVITPPLPWTE